MYTILSQALLFLGKFSSSCLHPAGFIHTVSIQLPPLLKFSVSIFFSQIKSKYPFFQLPSHIQLHQAVYLTSYIHPSYPSTPNCLHPTVSIQHFQTSIQPTHTATLIQLPPFNPIHPPQSIQLFSSCVHSTTNSISPYIQLSPPYSL